MKATVVNELMINSQDREFMLKIKLNIKGYLNKELYHPKKKLLLSIKMVIVIMVMLMKNFYIMVEE